MSVPFELEDKEEQQKAPYLQFFGTSKFQKFSNYSKKNTKFFLDYFPESFKNQVVNQKSAKKQRTTHTHVRVHQNMQRLKVILTFSLSPEFHDGTRKRGGQKIRQEIVRPRPKICRFGTFRHCHWQQKHEEFAERRHRRSLYQENARF